MVQAIWRICIIPAPHTLNYRESCAYQAVELRYELAALFQSSLLQPLPVLSLLPRGEFPLLPLHSFPPHIQYEMELAFYCIFAEIGAFFTGRETKPPGLAPPHR